MVVNHSLDLNNIKLKKEYPEANLSKYKPKKSIIDAVEIAYKSKPKNEPLSTKTIYDEFDLVVDLQF